MKTGQQIYETFLAGNIGPLQAAQELVVSLAREFDTEAQHLEKAQTDMMQYWEGDAADAAGRGVVPLIQANSESVPMIVEAGSSVQSQSDAYSWGKHMVEPVPPEPKEPSMWARGAAAVLPGVPDPDVAYREGMARHEAANANNVRVMDQYTSVTDDTSSRLPADYGIVEDDGASISIGTHASSVGGGPGVGSPGIGTAGYTPGGAPGSGVGPLGGGPSFGAGPTPGLPSAGPGGGGPVPGAGGPFPPGGGPAPAPAPAPIAAGGPRPAGPMVTPLAPVGGSTSESARNAGRTGGRVPAGSARAGARLSGAGLPSSGKTTSVLRGGAAAQARLAGGSAGLQAGKAAGALGGPGGAAGGAAAAKAAAGAGGRGSGGMAPGAAGQRGQGEEDGEHKDKYAVKEEFDTGLQVEYDESGAKTVDERTGATVVSPVIGESERSADPAGRAGQVGQQPPPAAEQES